MPEFDMDRRLRFAQLNSDSRVHLAAAWKVLEASLPSILERFYDHLETEPDLVKIFGGRAPDRLKKLQFAHWARLFEGKFDQEYTKGVYTVGMVHSRVGLEPRWYLAGYRFVLEEIRRLLILKGRFSRKSLVTILGAVESAVMLDIDLAISAYADAQEAGKQAALGSVIEVFGGALDALSQGDLHHQIDPNVSQAFQKMRSDFVHAVTQVQAAVTVAKEGAVSVQRSAEALADSANDLSSRTIEQAATLEETAAQAEEITKVVRRTDQGVREAAVLVTKVKLNATTGRDVAEEASQVMTKIEEASEEIEEIIGVIDDISGQTNLLSLNAAIEAAHAGSAGKGFEVVAGEVRKLANQASESAARIKSLIARSRGITEQGARLVRQSGEQFAEVSAQVAAMEGLVAGIAQASQEQALGVEQITVAVAEMSTVTNENAELVQHTKAAAQHLEHLAEKQAQALAFFRLS